MQFHMQERIPTYVAREEKRRSNNTARTAPLGDPSRQSTHGCLMARQAFPIPKGQSCVYFAGRLPRSPWQRSRGFNLPTRGRGKTTEPTPSQKTLEAVHLLI